MDEKKVLECKWFCFLFLAAGSSLWFDIGLEIHVYVMCVFNTR